LDVIDVETAIGNGRITRQERMKRVGKGGYSTRSISGRTE
jgi:hypothetical protein